MPQDPANLRGQAVVQSLGAIQAWAGGLKQGGTMGTEEEAHQGNQAGRPGVVCQCIEEGGGIWDDPEVLGVQETSWPKEKPRVGPGLGWRADGFSPGWLSLRASQ